MTEEEERLARAQAYDAEWEERRNQPFDPAEVEQACLDAIALIEASPEAFLQMRAFHRKVSHPGNPNIAQRMISETWLTSTDKAFEMAQKVKAKVEARNAGLPGPEDDPA